MCEVGTSRHGNRFNLGKQNHFLPSLVPPWHFCTISDNPPTTRRYDPCEWCEGVSIDHRWWDWVSWVLWHVSIWDSIPWWWWNTKYHCACHSRCISLLPHWTYPTHPSSSRSVPLLLRSFHLVIEPRVYCHHRSWCESPSWFIFHSSIFCTCSYLQCDNTWVHTRERIESHLTSVLPRLCNQTERKTCFKVFFVSSPPCSWIQATVVFVSHRIHDHSTRIRDIARSMPCFPQSDTYALVWDHQLVYEELYVLFSLLFSLTSYSHPIPCLTLMLVNQEWAIRWTAHRSCNTWLSIVSRFMCQSWSFVQYWDSNVWMCVFIFLLMYFYLSLLTPVRSLMKWSTRKRKTTHGLPWYALVRTRILNSPISSSIPSIQSISSVYSDSVFAPRNRIWTVV